MSKKAQMKKAPALAWDAEQLRCTIFPSESPLSRNLKQLWMGLMGEGHDEYFERQGQHQIVKKSEEYQFSIIFHLDRVHFYFTPLEQGDPQESPNPGFNVIGEYSKMLPIFIPAIEPWIRLEDWGPLLRVGIGANLFYPVESRIDGYKHLDRLLPSYTFNFDNTHEFSYRVNRRLDTELGGAASYINRISQWSVLKKQVIGFVIGDSAGIPTQALSPSKYVCRLFQDISTPNDLAANLDSSEVPGIVEHLHHLGTEIAEKGDIV